MSHFSISFRFSPETTYFVPVSILLSYLNILYIFTDDAFFNRNWAGACGSRWVGPRLLVG